MPSIAITTVTTIERKVKLPKRCPECKSDLSKPHSMREVGYVAFSSYCHLEGGAPQAEDEFEHDFADALRTRYECVGCGHVLAEG